MRRSFLSATAFAGALALGCTDQPAPTATGGDPALSSPSLARQAVSRFTRREPWEEDILNPCTGDVVHFTGEIKEQATFVGPPDLLEQGSALHIEDQTLLSGTGIDAGTGTMYSVRRSFHLSFNSPTLEASNFTQTINTTVRAITQGPDENFVIHFRFHITVLPNGEVATVAEVDSAECRG
jgi:hypothetical protein